MSAVSVYLHLNVTCIHIEVRAPTDPREAYCVFFSKVQAGSKFNGLDISEDTGTMQRIDASGDRNKHYKHTTVTGKSAKRVSVHSVKEMVKRLEVVIGAT
jgi:hypothetical protein